MNRRVVITGLGIVNPAGIGINDFWKSVSAGENNISAIPELGANGFPIEVAGKLKKFAPNAYVPSRFLVKVDTFTKYAWAAAIMAKRNADLDFDSVDRDRVGVWLGNNAGGWDICERGLYEMYRDGPEFVNPWQATAWFLSSPQGYLTIANTVYGMSKSFACDRASSASALYFAYRNIRDGINDVIFSGGTEAPITPFAMNCYIDIGEMANTKSDVTVYKPFGKEASGLLIGEGAAILVLEELDHARKRGAKIYGEILGVASFTDADVTKNTFYIKTMRKALSDAQISPDEINLVFAEGAGVVELDRLEANAIETVFSDHINQLAVTCPKSGYGHLYGASSATDLICGLLSSQDEVIAPTPNVEKKADYATFDLVTEQRHLKINRFLVNSRAREGVNFSLVVGT